jgi:pyrroline-5-carboxylate reductase
MNQQLKVGFLGAGVMASALIKGLIKSNSIACSRIIASDPLAASR